MNPFLAGGLVSAVGSIFSGLFGANSADKASEAQQGAIKDAEGKLRDAVSDLAIAKVKALEILNKALKEEVNVEELLNIDPKFKLSRFNKKMVLLAKNLKNARSASSKPKIYQTI